MSLWLLILQTSPVMLLVWPPPLRSMSVCARSLSEGNALCSS